MKLTSKGRFAVMSLVDIAINSVANKPVSLSDISSRQNISLPFLEQIFISLKKSGIVKSVRGPSGGYTFAKNPDFIKIYDNIKTGTYHCQENYEVAEDMSKLVLNNIHSVVYNLPPGTTAIDKFDKFLKKLENHFSIRLDQIKETCKEYYEKRGLDYNVRYPLEGPSQLPLDKGDSFQYFI